MYESTFFKGVLFCLLAALCWAVIGPLSRVCLDAGMTPGAIAFWRMAPSCLCFLLHAGLRGELHPRPRDLGVMVGFGGSIVALLTLAIQTSIQHSGGALAIILLFTAPAWVAIFSRLFFGEQLTLPKLSAMALAMLGTMLVCMAGSSLGPGAEISVFGLFCGLSSGLLYALQFAFFVWWEKRYSTAAIFAMTFTPASVVLLFFAGPVPLRWDVILALLTLSIITSYVAYYFYGISLRCLSQVQAAVIGNVEPAAGALLSWYFWDENFTAIGWLGCAIIMASVLLLALCRQHA